MNDEEKKPYDETDPKQNPAHVENGNIAIEAAKVKHAAWLKKPMKENERLLDLNNQLFDVDATLSALAAALDVKSDTPWSRSKAVQTLAIIVNDAAYQISEAWSATTGVWTDEHLVHFSEQVEKVRGVVELLGALDWALDGERMKTNRDPARVVSLVADKLDPMIGALEELDDLYRSHVKRFPKVHEQFATSHITERARQALRADHDEEVVH